MSSNATSADAVRAHLAAAATGAEGKPHVVILGGGFSGLSATRQRENAPVRVMMIDRANHFGNVATRSAAVAERCKPL